MLTTLLVLLLARDDIPRYVFSPGQEMTYTFRSRIEGDASKKVAAKEATTKVQINILSKNADGSFGILFVTQYNSDQPRPHWDARRADIFPDGRIINESEAQNGFFANLIPVLPKGHEREYSSVIERDGVTCHFTWMPGKNGGRIKEVRTGPLLNIYSVRTEYEYLYGGAASLSITSGSAKDIKPTDPNDVPYQHAGGAKSITFELSSSKMLPKEELAELNKQVKAFFALKKDRDDSYMQFRKRTAAEAKQRMEEVATRWKAAKAEFNHPALVALYDDGLKQIDNYPRWLSADCERRAEILNKPIPTWEAKDFEGKSYSSESLKGKVVILDFWYRGCLWCVRAMPQMNQLANELKNENVVILGVNIDENVDDAKFVIRQTQLNYPSLQFHPEMQKVRHHELLKCTFGYPTLLIIDQSGNLAEIHAGYSPTLKKEVLESVRKLLTSSERK